MADGNIASDLDPFILEVDVDVYSLQVVQKACYALMRYISCSVSKENKKYSIRVLPSAGNTFCADELERMLLDELLDYSLRERIVEQTEPVRNLILANAFSRTTLVE